MTTLRDRVVEAGARAIERAPGSYTVEMDTEAAAQAALDAMLDCLTENADEWTLQSWDHYSAENQEWVSRLLAVLRNPE